MTYIWAVHITLADEVRPTESVHTDEAAAHSHARDLSTDYGVLAASVIRFKLDQLGDRRNVAMYVSGTRQTVPHISNDRKIHGGGRSRS